MLAKWLSTHPRILILDEPTARHRRGDESRGASSDERPGRRRDRDPAMISSELPEVLGMSDRILVMHEGRTAGILDRRDANQVDLMRLAAH